MEFSWYVFLTIPVAWFMQNLMHELSHLLVGWIVEGRKPLGVYPYPHRYRSRFYFSRYISGEASEFASPKPRHIAPFFAGLFWFFLMSLVVYLVPTEWKIFFIIFPLVGLIDAGFFWYTYFCGSPESDGQRFKYNIG